MFLSNKKLQTIPIFRGIIFSLLALSTTLFVHAPASSAVSSLFNCERLAELVDLAQPIPERDLSLSSETVQCLVGLLPSYKLFADQRSDDGLSIDAMRYRVLTGALVGLFERDSRATTNYFRSFDNTDTAAVLAQGSRSPLKGVRINSARILANIVDNTTICVVIDFAWTYVSPSAVDNPDIHGRANLLNVASTVAPWARIESYAALDALHVKISQDLADLTKSESNNLKQTQALLGRLRKRLDIHKELENGGDSSPRTFGNGNLGTECRSTYKYVHDEVGEFFR